MELQELYKQITNDPNNGSLYIQLGDEYSKININHAYLCYEQASSLCEGDKYLEAINKMNSCKAFSDFNVHPTSFVILSYNSKDIMIECLEAIRNTCTKGSYEVIVVDSNSTDGIREWLQEQDDIKLILNDKFDGFAAGCNQGAKIAEPNNDIYLLNNDAIVTSRSLFYMRLALYSKEKIGAVGPVSSNVMPEQLYDTITRSHDEWMKLAESINHPSSNPIQYSHWLQGHALLIKRRVWDEVGMMDTNFKFGGHEDIEYGIRLNYFKHSICIVKNSFVYHYGSATMKSVSQKFIESQNRNRAIFEKKYNFSLDLISESKFYKALNYVNEEKNKDINVLQIFGGCGNFLNILKYNFPNANLHMIESNPALTRIASNYADSYFLDLDNVELPFKKESLDYIFFFEIEKVSDLKNVLNKFKDILKPNGHLIICGKNAAHISVIDTLIHGSFDAPLLKNSKSIYTTDDLRNIVSRCGYNIPRMSWQYLSSFSHLSDSQQKTLDMILSLPNAKDKNTYIHTSSLIDAQKDNSSVELKIKVFSNEKTLDFILQTHCSVARFGDGEFDLMSGRSIPYQDWSGELANELKQIVIRQNDLCFISCLPDVFERQERYNDPCRNFWKNHLNAYKSLYNNVCKSTWYGSTFLSRPYIDLEDKSNLNGYFDKLKLLWKNQDILIVEGNTSRSGVGNDLFANARSVKRIICPSRNAYSKINEIENQIRIYGKNKLILLMLGPTAKLISYHMYSDGYWLIDMGHVDSEYEWYKMGAQSKVKLNNKHTAEHNYDENITFNKDEEYEKQILIDLSD